MLIKTITDKIFKEKLPDYNENRAIQGYFENRNFMELDLIGIINQAFLAFEYLSSLMEEKTKRVAWLSFLERTVLCYI